MKVNDTFFYGPGREYKITSIKGDEVLAVSVEQPWQVFGFSKSEIAKLVK